jgi:hypothetical protein
MSSPEVKSKLMDTLKSTKELLKAAKAATQEQLRKNVPKVANYLDKSLDETSKAFSDFMGSLDKRTSVEQRELLKAYSSFLQKQAQIVDRRLSSLESEKPPDAIPGGLLPEENSSS